MTTFKPMLAASCDDMDAIKYPVLATPKIDGIRCLIIDGVATARSLKPIPNRYIQAVIGRPEYNGFDGELIVGSNFQQATSGVMSGDGEPDFTYFVFDHIELLPIPYTTRCQTLNRFVGCNRLNILLPVLCQTPEDLRQMTETHLAQGHEGTMIRSPTGPYKFGRATFREGYLTKIKPFQDDEATVIGFEEQMHNGNVATTNALGLTERSSHKENLTPKGTLGTLLVNHPKFGEFGIGTGFDTATRQQIWADRFGHLGRIVKFRYQQYGTKNKPRIPVFVGFRDDLDT